MVDPDPDTGSAQCDECGGTIDPPARGDFRATEVGVCTDCWFSELSAEERREYAARAERAREDSDDRGD